MARIYILIATVWYILKLLSTPRAKNKHAVDIELAMSMNRASGDYTQKMRGRNGKMGVSGGTGRQR